MPAAHTLGLATVALAACILQATGRRADGTVYTIAQVRAHLRQEPAAWMGHTLWLRGRLAGCPGFLTPAIQQVCQGWDRYRLTDATAPGTEPLVVAEGGPGPLLATLHRRPLLGALLPAPQALRWGADATYRVRLRPAPAARCYGALPCYEALLLDAASSR